MPETTFFWDPLSDNILQERDETGAVTAEYTTEPGLFGNLVGQNRGGVENQYHFDALGSTLALTDGNQQVTDNYAYSAFGEIRESTGSTVNPFQYLGQEGYYRDEVTGNYIARYVVGDPNAGRRLSIAIVAEVATVMAANSTAQNVQVLIDASSLPAAFDWASVISSAQPAGGSLTEPRFEISYAYSPDVMNRANSTSANAPTSRTVYVHERDRMPFEEAAIPFQELVPPELRRVMKAFPKLVRGPEYRNCKNECDVLFIWYANEGLCGPEWAKCYKKCPIIPRPIWGWCVQLIGFAPARVPCIIGWRTRQDCRDDCQLAKEKCWEWAFLASEKCRDDLGIPRKGAPKGPAR